MSITHVACDEYWTTAGFQPAASHDAALAHVLGRYCVPGNRVAELGCGDGTVIGRPAESLGATYVGVDADPCGVADAVAAGLDARLVDELSRSGLDGAGFDAVFVLDASGSLGDSDALLAEARRLLRPGGSLVLSAPNLPASLGRRLAARSALGRRPRSGAGRGADLRSARTALREVVREAGFASVELVSSGPAGVDGVLGWTAGRRTRRGMAIAVA